MKFLAKINRNYLVLFAVTLMTVTVADYFVLHMIIMQGAREKLMAKETLVKQHIVSTGETPNLYPEVEVSTLVNQPADEPQFRKVTIFNPAENENEVYLEYSGKISVNGLWYSVKLRQSLFENEDLILILVLSIFIILSAAFIISFFITGKMNRTVWSDFEHNLHEIENYRFSQKNRIALAESGTEEFDRLNKVIYNLTEKLSSDYNALREFAENASHEIQTPLAVALMNLEEIIQADLGEETFKKLTNTISALKRLSSLNQSLILLTKIDNRQFEPDTSVSFLELIRRKAGEYSAFFEAKGLKIMIREDHDFVATLNLQLADILVGNLLSNAINHNITGGVIQVSVSCEKFEICNTGMPNKLTDETIFDRFTKGTPGSFGLGLAIAKRICEIHNLDIHYHKNDYHCFYIEAKS
jgi:signal transduction histidine kinase